MKGARSSRWRSPKLRGHCRAVKDGGHQASGWRGRARGAQRLSALLQLPDEPLGGYIDSPRSALHRLDPRTKQLWLAAAVALPAGLDSRSKLAFSGGVALAGALSLPTRVWAPRVRQSAGLALLVLALTALSAPDDAPSMALARDPPSEIDENSIFPPVPSTQYSATLLSLGPLRVTRKSLGLALSASSVTFNSLECTALVQCTSKPEELAAGTRAVLSPLSAVGLDVNAVTVSLLLSLRFAAVVTDEIRNLASGLAARGISFGQLGFFGSLSLASTVSRKFVSNLLQHSRETAVAMQARDLTTSEPNIQQALEASTSVRFRLGDAAALAALVPVAYASVS